MKVKHILDHTLDKQMKTISPLDEDIDSKHMTLKHKVITLQSLNEKQSLLQSKTLVLQKRLDSNTNQRLLFKSTYKHKKQLVHNKMKTPDIQERDSMENSELNLQIHELSNELTGLIKREMGAKHKQSKIKQHNISLNNSLLNKQ